MEKNDFYGFEQLVDRSGTGSLKGAMTPQAVRDAGLVSFWGAEFDFPTCPAFSEGVKACAERGLYPFTLQGDAYNERVCWWLRELRGWEVSPDWIIPTHGTIFALAAAIRLLVEPHQSILTVSPTYNRYKQAADRLGRSASVSPMRYDPLTGIYTIDWADLEARMAREDTALFVLCNPNNPTGQALSEGELRRIDGLSRAYGVPVFCDEIFAEVVLEGDGIVPFGRIAGEDSLAMTCTSLGKCMSLTGVNHANLVIRNPELRERYIRQKYADHYGSIDPMLYAGLMRACTEEGRDYVLALREVIRRNRERFRRRLGGLFPQAKMVPAQGAYLAWVDYTGLGMSDGELAGMLEKGLFIGDPGSEYGASDQFYRYSIAAPGWAIEKTFDHLEASLGGWESKGASGPLGGARGRASRS